MRIGIQTWGSEGDIRPFLALAEGLQQAGHQVHLVITCVDSASYNGLQSRFGVKISTIASPIISPAQSEQIARTGYTLRNPMKQMATLLKLCFDPAEDQMFAAAQSLSLESDILIGHYFMHPLQIAAEHANRPYISVLLTHAAVPSDFTHPMSIPALGRIGNRVLWWLTKKTLNHTLLHYPNRLRQQLGMQPARDIVTQVWNSSFLSLVAVSPQICQQQADWPETTRVCGFLTRPQLKLDGSLPAAVSEFLSNGEPPLYLTLGSWMPKETRAQIQVLNLFEQAIRLVGCRAIIQAPSWQECGMEPSSQILYVNQVPHHLIFPRCRAIVHHGGAGTTHSVISSGRPSIVIANISEQEHWGRELQRLGMTDKPLKRHNTTAKVLAKQIRRVLAQEKFTANAEILGRAMRAEDGVAKAIAVIEQHLKQLVK